MAGNDLPRSDDTVWGLTGANEPPNPHVSGWGQGTHRAGADGWGAVARPPGRPIPPDPRNSAPDPWNSAPGPWTGAPGRADPWNSASVSPPEPFGGTSRSSTRPPLRVLWLGLLGPAIGAGLLFLSGWKWNIAGWGVSIIVGLGLLVAFTTIDMRRRSNLWYLSSPGLVAGLRIAVAASAIVVAAIHAYYLADYISRLDVWVS